MGVSSARRRQRLEAEALQIARGADIPRIGDDEAAGLVKLTKGLALVCNRGAGAAHARTRGVSGYRAARISAPRADILSPARAPCRRRADRPWRAGFPATASGSADNDSRRSLSAPPAAPPIPPPRSAYRRCP